MKNGAAFNSQDLKQNLPQQIALCLFRVLQEALQNAIKHSGVRRFNAIRSEEGNRAGLHP